jgi:putative ABC transport system permease protein
MNHAKNMQISLRALVRARSRTLLSASGMAIGIAAMVLLLGLGGGAEHAFQSALEEMGENLLAVSAERRESGALRGTGRQFKTLRLSDMQAIVEQVDNVQRAAPILLVQMLLRVRQETLSSTVMGTTPVYRLTNRPRLAMGRFFNDDEVEKCSRVAVLGSSVARELYGGEQPLGARLLIGAIPFTVIGVLQEQGADPTGADQDNRVLIPILTAQRRVMKVDHLDRIFLQADSRQALEVAQEGARALLRELHELGETAPDDFTIRTQEALLATLEYVDQSFTRLLAALAIVTLSLASVGLLATSLLSVRERHGEIGLRMTVGALPGQVLVQFLSESVMISLLGAFGGLLVGTCGIILGGQLMGWSVALTWESVLYPFVVSLGISITFGAYPAWRTARLDPIMALRST